MANPAGDDRLVVAVVGSPASDAAIRWAAGDAVMRGSAITLMHVVAPAVATLPLENDSSSHFHWQEDNARTVVEKAEKTLWAAVDVSVAPVVRTEVHHDRVADRLVSASAHATMVVVGSRGLGSLSGSVLGSVSRALLHRAHCPVAVVHAEQAAARDRAAPVLLGIDGSPASEAATAMAFDEASRRGVHLVALQAWSDARDVLVPGIDWRQYEQQGHEVLAERLAGWQEQYPDVHVHRRIALDRPSRWLLEESEQAQLVVLGSHGRGGFSRMVLGSVTTVVAEASKTPVIVVRG